MKPLILGLKSHWGYSVPRKHIPRTDHKGCVYIQSEITYNQNMVTQVTFKIPPIKERKRIPMRVIRALVNHIAENFSPDEIILFGSYAYGKPSPWSDVDLLVVMATPRGELETTLEIVDSLPPSLFSLDILARDRETIEQRKAMGDVFMHEITSKGKTLYARQKLS